MIKEMLQFAQDEGWQTALDKLEQWRDALEEMQEITELADPLLNAVLDSIVAVLALAVPQHYVMSPSLSTLVYWQLNDPRCRINQWQEFSLICIRNPRI